MFWPSLFTSAAVTGRIAILAIRNGPYEDERVREQMLRYNRHYIDIMDVLAMAMWLELLLEKIWGG